MTQQRYLHNRLSRRLQPLAESRLWLQVLLALGLGVATGLVLGPDLHLVSRETATLTGEWLALPGRLFLAAIRMVIIPLAASSIVLGVTGAGGGETLRAIGFRLGLFVLLTTGVATLIGATLAMSANFGGATTAPGSVAEAPSPVADSLQITRQLPSLITDLIPQNIAASVLEQDMLAIVVFSLFVGIAAVNADKRELTTPLVDLARSILEVSMSVIRIAMRLAPIAVFGLIAETIAANGMATLMDLALYCGVVVFGLGGLLLFYIVIVMALGGMSPLQFMKAVGPVQLLAFSTSSSAAVMPLTMKTAVDKLNTPPAIAGAVVPLASTVNMAGTALYQTVAIVFLAATAGRHLAPGELALIMVTLTGASIGAPAAPGASIAILSATAANFGVPLTAIPLVMGVDRLLDMARTSVNVTGDLVLCRILAPRVERTNAAGLESTFAGDEAVEDEGNTAATRSPANGTTAPRVHQE